MTRINEGYYECDQCGKKEEGEPPFVFSVKGNTKSLCCEGCFLASVAKEFNVEIAKISDRSIPLKGKVKE